MTARTMDLSVMLSGNTAFVNSDTQSAEISWEELQSND